MASSAHDAALPRPLSPLRKLVIPATLWTLATAAFVVLKRRAQRPSVSPLSDEWLRNRAIYRDHDR